MNRAEALDYLGTTEEGFNHLFVKRGLTHYSQAERDGILARAVTLRAIAAAESCSLEVANEMLVQMAREEGLS